MINIENNNKDQNFENNDEEKSKKPDEYSGMYIRGFVRITDPESGQIIVETAN